MEFVAARLDLFALEAKDAGKLAARRGALVAVITGCAMMAWMAAVAGLIGWVATAGAGIDWYFVALGAAGFHLVLAGIAAYVLRRPAPQAFPLTKAEISKDREWLLHLKDKPQP